jgi:hypothetical protein
MLSQTNVHWLAINKLDLVTAHNRCLRIIQLRCFHRFVTEPQSDDRPIHALLKKIHGNGVAKHMDGDAFLFERGADLGRGGAMFG